MTVIKIKSLSKEVQKKLVLNDWTIDFNPATISAFCTNKPESINVFFQLLLGKEKEARKTISLDGLDAYKDRKKIVPQIGYKNEEIKLTKHGDVQQLLTTIIKKNERALKLDYAEKIVKQCHIDLNSKLADLSDGEKQQLEIILFTVQKLPLILLDQPTKSMNDKQATQTWQLLHDYVKKTNATVIFISDSFEEMQQYADSIVYVKNGRITNQRELVTHDSIDSTVTITGTGFPIELAQKIGATVIQEAPRETKIVFSGTIQALLPLLEQTGITDVRIADATIEDELMIY
ncbi:ATP-binding cassette domain-containing protein [Paucilactobacillus kaifaensis]|uniref:ATP-binding cassette domain-containing protein n=1 Tax=Paucilactobacillus kaifaensis TaxID=2559921 RepID=UPI0014856058|nr:ATP-binding cassette domain-containing protein [Paucilactobacillus kaifaensis]